MGHDGDVLLPIFLYWIASSGPWELTTSFKRWNLTRSRRARSDSIFVVGRPPLLGARFEATQAVWCTINWHGPPARGPSMVEHVIFSKQAFLALTDPGMRWWQEEKELLSTLFGPIPTPLPRVGAATGPPPSWLAWRSLRVLTAPSLELGPLICWQTRPPIWISTRFELVRAPH